MFSQGDNSNPWENDAISQGIIPRTIAELFKLANELSRKDWWYTIRTSYIEVYNDSIYDLLADPAAPEQKHDVHMDASTNQVTVSNTVWNEVCDEQAVLHQLRVAALNRATACTQMNERSSRSHSIFRIQLEGENDQTGDSCMSTLNLVDLAGSERLSSVAPVAGTGLLLSSDFGTDELKLVAQTRLRETQNINKSLAALSNVMLALQRKLHHVPYRDSKLTRVLQSALGGNSKRCTPCLLMELVWIKPMLSP